ncbi:MAG: transglycosylase domain-containing protein [Actinomycetota bacterium]|nr:transglycosylase domain-containing protein [Actinomycetota bacterium]
MSLKTPRLAIVFCALLAVLGTACEQLENLPKLTAADLREPNLAQTSKIYDADGNLLKTLHGIENRTVIPLKKIPRKMQRAVIAIEDERFFEHDGVDYQAIMRAAFANAASGSIQQGGSTITQQYVKNAIISPGASADKTFERKVDEAVLALQLEEELSKKEILSRYLNTVYFGNGAYGVQAAARTYFRHSAKKLTLKESALLAGIIRSPETYNPHQNREAALKRRGVVLDKMLELGWANEAKVAKIAGKGMGIEELKEEGRYPAPYFVDYVQRLIKFDKERFPMLGETIEEREQRLFTGGLKIHTTVDLGIQAAADAAVNAYLTETTDPYGSLVAIDPHTGHVKAMVGGRDFFSEKKTDPYAKINLAIQHEPNLGRVKDCGADEYEYRAPGCGRQAGSAYKPFALVAALEEGISLSDTYEADDCISFPEYNWHPCNYEEGAFGETSLLKATAYSVNVVYAQVALEVGPEDVVRKATQMGITTPQDPYASAVLGTNEVNPLNMTSAYGTLATNGVHHPPVAITRIEDANGKVIYRDPKVKEKVILPAVAYITTTALEDVVEYGTGGNAELVGQYEAGKTGTAQGYSDAWFAGYTPNLAAAVWVGHPAGQISMESTRIGPVFGGSWPALIWQHFMTAMSGTEYAGTTPFPEPDVTLITLEIDRDTGCLANDLTPDEDKEIAEFIPGTEGDVVACRGERGETATVPDVVEYEAPAALETLQSAGFEVAQEYEATSTYPPGRVIYQDPEGGTEVAKGTTVTITVSTTSEGDGTVPSLLGVPSESAQDALVARGYMPDVIEQAESSKGQAKKNSGLVWKQDPSSGTEAEPGTTVTIWVNP